MIDTILFSAKTTRSIATLTIVTVFAALYGAFVYAPDEIVMGAVQRVFYFHVGTAIASYALLALLFFCSIGFLARRTAGYDVLGDAAADVAFLFCSIVLATGMIWGHSAWNAFWNWEPRLVSFLVLWLLLFGYRALSAFAGSSEESAVYRAVLGIVAVAQVPVVIFSVKLLDHTQQLHPQVVGRQGLSDERMVVAFCVSIVAMLLLGTWAVLLRSRGGWLQRLAQQALCR